MAGMQWQGLNKLYATLRGLADPDFSPLMVEWEKTIVEGNRRGVLSGLDGFDRPMPPLRYRNGKGKRTSDRKGAARGVSRSLFHQVGPQAVGLHGNLTTREYQKLTGPRLAPRREASRVITNLKTQSGRDGSVWFAEGAWFDVISTKGVPFLMAHFLGRNRLPRYDLRPIRAKDKATMARQLKTFVVGLLKKQG